MSAGTAGELTALQHLQELARRLLTAVVVALAGAIAAYIWRLHIIEFLQQPLHERLYYTSPMGSFQFVMQICMLCGIALALPVAIYNLLRYMEPVLAKGFSRKFVLVMLSGSVLLTAAGVLFAYYVTLPFALKFFTVVAGQTLTPLISISEYSSFMLSYLATFAVVFQLPLLLLFINYITPFGQGGLSRWRRHVWIGAFGISLIMPSSPDPLSQVSLAIPIVILYELSLVLIWRVNRKRRKALRLRRVRQMQLRHLVPAAAPIHGPAPAQPFPATRMQQPMRGAEQGQLKKAPTEVARVAQSVRASVHRDCQQPVARTMRMDSPPRERLINDILQ